MKMRPTTIIEQTSLTHFTLNSRNFEQYSLIKPEFDKKKPKIVQTKDYKIFKQTLAEINFEFNN